MKQITGMYKDGAIQLDSSVDWPEGAAVLILHMPQDSTMSLDTDQTYHMIIAGYGLAGRFVADVFRRHEVPFVVVERNPRTVDVQRELGANIIEGDIRDEQVLREAGIERATMLALTIPDEQAVLEATQVARRLNRHVFIIARTQYASVGLQAAKLGADEVVQAEYAVAMQFYQSFLRKLQAKPDTNGSVQSSQDKQ